MSKKTKKQIFPILLLFTLVLVFTSTTASAEAEGDLWFVINNLQVRYDSIDTLSANFTQEAYSSSLKSSEHAKGTVAFKKPGMMRWDYFGGGQIISNSIFIWIFQPDLAQVIETRVDPFEPSITTDFLAGIGKLEDDFFVKLVSSDARGYRLNLVPKMPMGNTRELIVEISRDFLLKKTIAIDNFNNETRVKFFDIRINTYLPNDIFEYKEEKGIKIIRP